jgi:transcriptional regulator with XRE-family HTH domain
MPESFGDFLQRLRRQKGLTQRHVATHLGIEPTYLSKVENDVEGYCSLSEEKLVVLSLLLEADSDEVLTRAGKVPSDVRRMLVDDISLIKEIRSRYNEDPTHESEA